MAGLGARYAWGSYGDDYEGALQIASCTVYDASRSYDPGQSACRLKGVKLSVNVRG